MIKVTHSALWRSFKPPTALQRARVSNDYVRAPGIHSLREEATRLQHRGFTQTGVQLASRKAWSAEEVERLETLHGQGKSLREIAQTVQRSWSAVSSRLCRLQRIGKSNQYSKPWSDEDLALLRSIMQEKLTEGGLDALATRLQRSRSALARKMHLLRKEAGLTEFRKPNIPKAWSQGEYDVAARLRNESQSYAHIAKTLGRSLKSVYEKLKRGHSSGGPSSRLSEAEIEHVEKLHSQGASFTDIHKAMSHRGESSILKILRRISGGARGPAHKPWSYEEIATLRDLRRQGKSWIEVAHRLPGRSTIACQRLDTRRFSPHDESRLESHALETSHEG